MNTASSYCFDTLVDDINKVCFDLVWTFIEESWFGCKKLVVAYILLKWFK